MFKTAPVFLFITVCCAILAALPIVMTGQPVFGVPVGAFINNSASLSSLARRQFISGKREESIALYQKAIEKAEQDYGNNSLSVGDLNYEMGVRAYDIGRFDLAERSLKKAADINRNSLSAQLMLVQLLRFRNRNSEAYRQMELTIKKHWNVSEARKGFMLCLQDVDPASATQQAYIINCLQNGYVNNIPKSEMPQSQAKPPMPQAQDKNQNNIQNKSVSSNKTDTVKANPAQKTDIKGKDKLINKASIKNNNPNKTPKTPSAPKSRTPKTHKSINSPSLLVPPPPIPNWFGMMNAKNDASPEKPAQPALKAKANSIKKSKPVKTAPNNVGGEEKATEAPEPVQHASKHPAESDSDFLLDWAGTKKKPNK